MKRLNIKTLALACALLAGGGAAHADMAKPGIWHWPQADGSVLNVNVEGDENHHFYLSEDGYVLVKDGGYFYYGICQPGQAPVSSAVRASNVAERTPAEKALLAGIDKDALRAAAVTAGAVTPQGMMRAGMGLFSGTNFPSTGSQRGLVILVEFSDKPFYSEDPLDYFSRMLNEEDFSDYTATGSARDYFLASSMGQFDFTLDVYGPVTMPNGYAYYGSDTYGQDANVREMVITACQMLNGEIDFTRYDSDNNGVIDNVCIIYAGYGQSSYADTDCIWPHRSTVSGNYTFDGKKLSGYSCSNEWQTSGTSGMPVGPGTFCHEFSHVLGLPDTYSTSNTGGFTPGVWDIMSSGNYNNNGFSPPLYCAQERYALGWLTPTVISGSMNATLEPLIDTNTAYMIRTSAEREYYLLENRQHKGWDKYLPGHGMLVWHIDFNQSLWDRNQVNNNVNHQYVDIVEADDVKSDATRSADTFPGAAGITEFTDETSPALKAWSGASLNLPLTEITEHAPSGNITFKVAGGEAPCASPVASAATAVTARSFKAQWTQVAGADAYLLSVFTRDADGNVAYAPGFEARNMGTATSFTVSGLEPSTDYIYTVSAREGTAQSLPSNEISFSTPALTHAYVIPVAKEATAIGDHQFTASWDAVDGAQSYIVNVTRRKMSGTTEAYNGFDGKFNEWFASPSATYNTSKIFAGLSTPSVQLGQNEYVSTPELEGAPRTFSFWHRGKSTDAGASVGVEALVAECWSPVASFEVCTKSGGATYTVGDFPAEATAVRVIFRTPVVKGQFYVDDLTVVSGGSATTSPVVGYIDANVGNVTSVVIDGLGSGTEYFYTVKAVKDGVQSMESRQIRALTTGEPSATNPGDINGDGAIDAVDIAYIVSAMLGSTPADFNAENADLNGDGTIDSVDVAIIISMMLS